DPRHRGRRGSAGARRGGRRAPAVMRRRGTALMGTTTAIPGRVAFVGAGPGGARADAERRYVGKQGGAPFVPQEETEALMLERARSGALVVRLKGGDPFVFGRGGEEALTLRAAGIPFE